MTKKNWRNLGASCILGVLTFCAVCFQWFSSLNLLLQDIVYQRSGQVNPNIKVIAIDEKTLQALGPFETWTREPYAQLIETLNQGEDAPKVIALYVLLTGEKGEEDQLLLNVCRESSNVVMASNLVFSTQLERDNGTAWANAMHIDMVEEPFGELAGVVKTDFANTVQDRRDNTVRYTLLEREGYLSFAAAIVKTAQGEIPYEKLSIDGNGGMLIDYTGVPGAYETLSLIDVLQGKIPSQAFRGSIVLVGAYAAGMGDAYSVPTSHGSQMYGVEILDEYLSLVTQAIFKNDGTLDKFISDAAMAVFNAPFDSPDYVYKAVCAARAVFGHYSPFQRPVYPGSQRFAYSAGLRNRVGAGGERSDCPHKFYS